jgi:hypothetical protein
MPNNKRTTTGRFAPKAPQTEPTPLAMAVMKKQPSHWIRSGVTALVILLGDSGLHIDTLGKLDDANARAQTYETRNAVLNAKLDFLISQKRDTVLVHDTIFSTGE